MTQAVDFMNIALVIAFVVIALAQVLSMVRRLTLRSRSC